VGGAGSRLDRQHLHGHGHLSRTGTSRTNPEPGGNPGLLAGEGRRVAGPHYLRVAQSLPRWRYRDRWWEAEFDDVTQDIRKRMREVAILVFEGQLIASLREYWSSEPIGHI